MCRWAMFNVWMIERSAPPYIDHVLLIKVVVWLTLLEELDGNGGHIQALLKRACDG